jgi:aerobic carbon-monoxide dehydrogenase medium subunit
MLAPFIYTAPESLDEAIQLLKENDSARLLAGGQSLLTEMKLHHISPSMLIDLHKIQALRGMKQGSDGILHIGAMTTFMEITEDKGIQENYAILVEAVNSTSDVQVRNCRTIGGAMAFSAFGADLPAVGLALGATLTLSGPQGTFTIPVAEFNTEALQDGQLKDVIITSVNFPSIAADCGNAYIKFKNRANDSAICGVATSVTLAPDNTLRECRIAVTGSSRYATQLTDAEAVLNGKPATAETIEKAAQIAGKHNCISDLAASAEYRAHLTSTLTESALIQAIVRACRGCVHNANSFTISMF